MASICPPVLPPRMFEVDLSGPRSPVSGWTNPCGNGVTLWPCLCALGGGPLIPGRFPWWLSCPPVVPPLGAQIVAVSTASRSPWDALSLATHRAEGLGNGCSDSCPDIAYDLGSSLSPTSWANYVISWALLCSVFKDYVGAST